MKKLIKITKKYPKNRQKSLFQLAPLSLGRLQGIMSLQEVGPFYEEPFLFPTNTRSMTKMIKAITMDCSSGMYLLPIPRPVTREQRIFHYRNFLLYIKTLKIAFFDAENFIDKNKKTIKAFLKFSLFYDYLSLIVGKRITSLT